MQKCPDIICSNFSFWLWAWPGLGNRLRSNVSYICMLAYRNPKSKFIELGNQRGHDLVHGPELEMSGFQTLEVPGFNHCPKVAVSQQQGYHT